MSLNRIHRYLCLLVVAMFLLASCSEAPDTSSADVAADDSNTTSADSDTTDDSEYADEEEPAADEEKPATDEEPTEEPAADTSRGDGGGGTSGSADTSGTYVADLGFRPTDNGFSFENYGGQGEINLTDVELRRMFGDTVCAGFDGDTCILSPVAAQWMDVQNSSMSGGHCEGMAVLSNLFYTGYADPNAFGAASVPELTLNDNDALQREIAYWFTTQATMPAREGIVPQTPSGVVNTLMTSLAAGASGGETYAVGIYKRDFSGGHAVTPYAVEDRGDGIYWIMVYDNNYPGAERAIEVDTNADTWRYAGSTNPEEPEDEYEGDASTQTLELAPISTRLSQQACPFCDESGVSQGEPGAAKTLAQAGTPRFNEVWLEGTADLLITDLEGHRLGFDQGVFVNEIPGARTNANKFGVNVWDIDAEPGYFIPTDIDFTISIDGSRLTEQANSTVTMIGPGYVLEVSDILLDPGQVDTLDVAPDGSLLSYRTESPETPLMLIAIETDASDYLFGVYGYELAAGEAVNLSLDTTEGWVSVDSIDNTESGTYSLAVMKYDDEGEQIFGADGIVLEPDDVVYVDYLKWPGNGQPMSMDVDYGGDGEVDEVLEIEDITDSFEE